MGQNRERKSREGGKAGTKKEVEGSVSLELFMTLVLQ